MNKHRNAIYSNALSTAPAMINDFKAKAKELGIDVSSFKELKELDSLIGKVKEYIKLFNTK